MTDAQPKKLDLAAVFTGQAFPKDIVVVYLDEVTSYAIHKLNKDSIKAVRESDHDEAKRIESELKTLIEKAQPSRYEIHLTGVSRQERKLATEETLEKFPTETDMLGREKPNAEANELYANLVWKQHVEKIVAPDGSVLENPTLEDIIIFRNHAPDVALSDIEAGIRELSEGVKDGFETLVQEHDFLSQR